MDNLDKVKNGDIGSLRINEASRWVGTDLIKKTNSTTDLSKLQIDPDLRNDLINNQAKINRLKEEKMKMQREHFPMIDELDILEKELSNKDYAQ